MALKAWCDIDQSHAIFLSSSFVMMAMEHGKPLSSMVDSSLVYITFAIVALTDQPGRNSAWWMAGW